MTDRVKLMDEQREFLRRLALGLPLGVAHREEDRARQWCRRNGLAEVVMNPRRWVITDLGRSSLTEQQK